MPDEPLTPMEESRARNSHRFYAIKEGFHNGLATALDARFNLPLGQTVRTIREPDSLPLAADGRRLLAVSKFLLSDEDFESIFNTRNPNIEELLDTEYEALKPAPAEP